MQYSIQIIVEDDLDMFLKDEKTTLSRAIGGSEDDKNLYTRDGKFKKIMKPIFINFSLLYAI